MLVSFLLFSISPLIKAFSNKKLEPLRSDLQFSLPCTLAVTNWMLAPPPVFLCWSLDRPHPRAMVSGGGAFGKESDRGEVMRVAPHNGISRFIRRRDTRVCSLSLPSSPSLSLSTYTCTKRSGEHTAGWQPFCKEGRGPSPRTEPASTMTLNSPAFRTVRSKHTGSTVFRPQPSELYASWGAGKPRHARLAWGIRGKSQIRRREQGCFSCFLENTALCSGVLALPPSSGHNTMWCYDSRMLRNLIFPQISVLNVSFHT